MPDVYHFRHCCGTAELGTVHSKTGPEAVLESIGSRKYGVYVFTDAVQYGYGRRLADYITANSLGKVFETPPVKNPNSGNDIIVWSWLIDQPAYNKWVRDRLAAKKAEKAKGAPVPAAPVAVGVFPVGTTVRVTNTGQTYDTNHDNLMLTRSGRVGWRSGALPNDGDVGTVLDAHGDQRLIEIRGQRYIMGIQGLHVPVFNLRQNIRVVDARQVIQTIQENEYNPIRNGHFGTITDIEPDGYRVNLPGVGSYVIAARGLAAR